MAKSFMTLLLAAVLCLALWPVPLLGQSAEWKAHDKAGIEAYQRARYAEAEREE
jgi:hypothetical protein